MKKRNDKKLLEKKQIKEEQKRVTKLKYRYIETGIALFILVTIMFSVSVNMRAEYKDYVSTGHHHHLTATSVIFTNNWLDDGIINDHFAMMPNPESVEFETLKDRSFYDSYPPGCILPLYILAKLMGKSEITFGFVQRWNLFNQYAITLLLAFIVYLMFIRMKKNIYIGFITAVIPVVINLFMPAPFYFFHSVYFSDQAVLLPFVLTVFLEILRLFIDGKKGRKILAICEGVVIFFGTLTDYLYVCFLVVLYVKRLLMKEISFKNVGAFIIDSVKLAAPALVAMGLFIIQIVVNGPVRILEMFLYRTGFQESPWITHFERVFWKDHMGAGYGAYSRFILKAALVIVVVMILAYICLKLFKKYENKNIAEVLSVAAMLIIPCFMQVYLLKNHSAIHDFSSLKFSIVLSLVPYVLLPIAITWFIEDIIKQKNPKAKPVLMEVLLVALVVWNCFNVATFHKENAKSFFPEPELKYEKVGNFLRENTDFNDVVFSNNYVIDESNNCPQSIAFSKKRVYKVEGIEEIYNKVKNISNDYTVNIFSYSGEAGGFMAEIVQEAFEHEQKEGMHLYKISKEDFMTLVE